MDNSPWCYKEWYTNWEIEHAIWKWKWHKNARELIIRAYISQWIICDYYWHRYFSFLDASSLHLGKKSSTIQRCLFARNCLPQGFTSLPGQELKWHWGRQKHGVPVVFVNILKPRVKLHQFYIYMLCLIDATYSLKYMNWEFPDAQAGLEKAEEPQISNILWNTEKTNKPTTTTTTTKKNKRIPENLLLYWLL